MLDSEKLANKILKRAVDLTVNLSLAESIASDSKERTKNVAISACIGTLSFENNRKQYKKLLKQLVKRTDLENIEQAEAHMAYCMAMAIVELT